MAVLFRQNRQCCWRFFWLSENPPCLKGIREDGNGINNIKTEIETEQ
jgi:hypothetical protein